AAMEAPPVSAGTAEASNKDGGLDYLDLQACLRRQADCTAGQGWAGTRGPTCWGRGGLDLRDEGDAAPGLAPPRSHASLSRARRKKLCGFRFNPQPPDRAAARTGERSLSWADDRWRGRRRMIHAPLQAGLSG